MSDLGGPVDRANRPLWASHPLTRCYEIVDVNFKSVIALVLNDASF